MHYKWDLVEQSVGCTGDRKSNRDSLAGDSDSEVLSKTYALHIWLLAVEIHLTDALLLTGETDRFLYVCLSLVYHKTSYNTFALLQSFPVKKARL
jgi:hypothetical protein